MKAVVSCVVLLVLGLAGAHPRAPSPTRSDHWGANMTTTELIEAFGYPSETHHVTTSDGYILEFHRIPHGAAPPTDAPRMPVLLQHGLVQSSADWIMNTVDEALGYILADAGYDVWMANARGNTYSRHHTTLDPDNGKDFWAFSWDQIGETDIPTVIDYILDSTGSDDLFYVGFSMGTTSFWAMMNDHPEYNQKVRAMVAMAPVAYLAHAKGLLWELAPYAHNIDMVMSLLGGGELLPSTELLDKVVEQYCDMESSMVEYCYNLLFLLCGFDPSELNKEYLPVIMAHTPAGTSIHTLNHYAQLMLTNEFTKYDWGRLGNLNHYGQIHPPSYDLAKVTAPVALFWSDNDFLADPKDVARLAQELPNVVLNHHVPLPEFNHLDFTWAIHANEYVYTHILKFLAEYA